VNALAQPHPRSLSPRGLVITGWLALFVAGVIFFSVAEGVATHEPIVILDGRIATWLHAHATIELAAFLYAITQVHSMIGLTVMSIVFAGVLWRMKERYWVLTLAVAVGGGMALNVLLKHFYERARPHFDDPWVTLSTYSFPSGHTAGATLFYGVLAAFLVSRFYDRRSRITVIAGAVIAIAMVALSRMYLGAHYLSDVVAATASSAAWLVLCLSTVHGLVKRRIAKNA
jgi:membrane-associated phospholipid phosphatase